MSTPAFYQPGSMVTFSIQAGGRPIPDSINVISIAIEKRVNQFFSAQFVLLDGDPGTGDFAISSSDLFVPGSAITINAGYNGQDSPLFKGKVTAQNISIKTDAAPTLTVDCRSELIEGWTINHAPVITLQYGTDLREFDASFSRPDNVAKVYGTVEFQGSALAEPGKYISLTGLGSRFSGNHLVSGVVHRIEDGNWVTKATIGLPG